MKPGGALSKTIFSSPTPLKFFFFVEPFFLGHPDPPHQLLFFFLDFEYVAHFTPQPARCDCFGV